MTPVTQVLGLRLYTGPMFVWYNVRVLRKGIKGQYVTTIHCISSAVIKLSRQTAAATVYRGVAGGVRVPDAASVVQWWMALGTDELDRQYPGMDVPDIGQLRQDFLKHLPQEQPMLSLTLAGVKHEQAVRTNESIKLSQNVYTFFL